MSKEKLIMREHTGNTEIETSICPICKENKLSKIGKETCEECRIMNMTKAEFDSEIKGIR